MPTKPPASPPSPSNVYAITLPIAYECVTLAPISSWPTKPPTLSFPVTFPIAYELLIIP